MATRTDAQVILQTAAAESGTALHLGHYPDAMVLTVGVEGIAGGDTLTPQGTMNGSDWYTLEGQILDDGTDIVSIAEDGLFRFNVAGLTSFRLTKVGTNGVVTAVARAVRA